MSQAGFPYGAVRDVLIDGIPATMFRISYVGENGWEVYTRMEHGLRLWDTIAGAGEEFGIIPVGIGVYAVTGRIEKGYRLMGAELESEYNPVEAGLARPKVKSADFIGKEAYLKARDAEVVATMCTLSVLDHADAPMARPLHDGWQRADLHDRRRAHRRCQRPRLRVTTAGAAPSLGSYLLLAYLPPEHAVEGTELRVMYMNELLPGDGRPRRQHTPLVRPRRQADEVADHAGARLRQAGAGAHGARINITADGRAVDTAFLGFTMSPHEECAVEEAVRIVEKHGGSSTVLTLGPGDGGGAVALRRQPRRERRRAHPDRRARLGSATDGRGDHRVGPAARGGRRSVRRHPLRQRVRRCREDSRSASAWPSPSTGRS